MTVPSVSVVIIFFNAELFLDEAIASVRAQTFDDWELILVDDGSTDGSAAIAERWATREPGRISRLQHAGGGNRGMSASRALGLLAARGEYVAYLDADDVWEPDALAVRVEEMRRWPGVDMIYGPATYWHAWTSDAAQQDRAQDLGIPLDAVYAPPHLVRHFLARSEATPAVGTILYRREALRAHGGPEESFRGMYEDQVVALKFAFESRILVSSHRICRYRQHAASACSISFGDGTHLAARLQFLDWVAGFMAASGHEGTEIATTLRQQRRKAAASGSQLRGLRRAAARVLPTSVVKAARRRLYGD